ncbi:MAG: Hsp20/alpha crystallin family protein [Bacteroidia bacterium]
MKSLIKWNGNGNKHLFPEFPSLFDDFLTRDLFSFPMHSAFNGSSVPAVNVKETDSAFELEMAAPGMEKKDFTIELERDTLIISAQKENKSEEKNEDGRYQRKEFSYQSFKRSFNLPEDLVKADEISANYKEGILHIMIPKKEPAKPKLLKQISIT